MTRPIRFRAWVPSEKQMRRLGKWTFEFVGEEGALQMMNDQDGTIAPIPAGTVLMQFTGLKDKNGKEIYEGDILRLSCGYVEGNPDHSFIAIVAYDQDRFKASLLDKKMHVKGGSEDGKILPQWEVHSWVGMHTCLTEWEKHREIIGNIYENPELLK